MNKIVRYNFTCFNCGIAFSILEKELTRQSKVFVKANNLKLPRLYVLHCIWCGYPITIILDKDVSPSYLEDEKHEENKKERENITIRLPLPQ